MKEEKTEKKKHSKRGVYWRKLAIMRAIRESNQKASIGLAPFTRIVRAAMRNGSIENFRISANSMLMMRDIIENEVITLLQKSYRISCRNEQLGEKEVRRLMDWHVKTILGCCYNNIV